MHEGVPIAIWVNFPPLVFFSLYPFESIRVCVIRTTGWLGGEAGHSDERPVTSLLPPLLKEHWHSKKPLVVVSLL